MRWNSLVLFIFLFFIMACSGQKKEESTGNRIKYDRIRGGCVIDGVKAPLVREHVGECGDLSGLDFSKRSFAGISLRGSNFSGSNLSETDFSNADLSATDFSGATLWRTNFKGAIFSETTVLPFSKDEAVAKGMVFRSFAELDREFCVYARDKSASVEGIQNYLKQEASLTDCSYLTSWGEYYKWYPKEEVLDYLLSQKLVIPPSDARKRGEILAAMINYRIAYVYTFLRHLPDYDIYHEYIYRDSTSRAFVRFSFQKTKLTIDDLRPLVSHPSFRNCSKNNFLSVIDYVDSKILDIDDYLEVVEYLVTAGDSLDCDTSRKLSNFVVNFHVLTKAGKGNLDLAKMKRFFHRHASRHVETYDFYKMLADATAKSEFYSKVDYEAFFETLVKLGFRLPERVSWSKVVSSLRYSNNFEPVFLLIKRGVSIGDIDSLDFDSLLKYTKNTEEMLQLLNMMSLGHVAEIVARALDSERISRNWMIDYLVSRGWDVNKPIVVIGKPEHLIHLCTSMECVSGLAAKGADVNLREEYGATPVMRCPQIARHESYSCRYNSSKCSAALLSCIEGFKKLGADIHAVRKNGEDVLNETSKEFGFDKQLFEGFLKLGFDYQRSKALVGVLSRVASPDVISLAKNIYPDAPIFHAQSLQCGPETFGMYFDFRGADFASRRHIAPSVYLDSYGRANPHMDFRVVLKEPQEERNRYAGWLDLKLKWSQSKEERLQIYTEDFIKAKVRYRDLDHECIFSNSVRPERKNPKYICNAQEKSYLMSWTQDLGRIEIPDHLLVSFWVGGYEIFETHSGFSNVSNPDGRLFMYIPKATIKNGQLADRFEVLTSRHSMRTLNESHTKTHCSAVQ